jgi:hypothetical protein
MLTADSTSVNAFTILEPFPVDPILVDAAPDELIREICRLRKIVSEQVMLKNHARRQISEEYTARRGYQAECEDLRRRLRRLGVDS